MLTSIKILYNTIALYAKMIITTILSLYITRIILDTLGVEDFGIFNLIGGIIALLSFLNSALMTSSQRFLSVAQGEHNMSKVNEIYSASVLIHIVMALAILFVLEISSMFLFDGFLSINENRVYAAKVVYHLMVVSTLATILGVPFNAEINANEDLWFFAIVETVCAILKVGVIVLFRLFPKDALITFTFWVMILSIVNSLVKYMWCRVMYPECKSVKYNIDRNLLTRLLGFTGWNALGSLALIGRNQGVAILLNVFWGTAINAVYGIANQVNSQLIYFSTMMTTSMTPQIMKSKGEGNYDRMLKLSFFTSKLAFFLSAVFAIPLLIELPYVLNIWLKEVPQYTEIYCSLTLLMFLVMQLYPGIPRVIQASGNIKWYQIITSILLLMPIPIGCILFNKEMMHYSVIYAMIVSQIVQMIAAVIMAKKLVGMNAWSFTIYAIKALVVFLVVYFLGMYIRDMLLNMGTVFTFVGVVVITMLMFSLLYYIVVLDRVDRIKIKETANAITNNWVKS